MHKNIHLCTLLMLRSYSITRGGVCILSVVRVSDGELRVEPRLMMFMMRCKMMRDL